MMIEILERDGSVCHIVSDLVTHVRTGSLDGRDYVEVYFVGSGAVFLDANYSDVVQLIECHAEKQRRNKC